MSDGDNSTSQQSTENETLISQLREALGGQEAASQLSDRDCMRFIRARKFDIEKASAMAAAWITWWNTPFGGEDDGDLQHTTPSNILTMQEVDPTEEIYTEFCPHIMFGFSKEGHPIFWEKTGLISNSLKQLKAKTTVTKLVVRHVRLQETMLARLDYINKKLGKSNTDSELEKFVVVFDLKNLAFSPDMFGINYVRDMFTCDGKYYPERLHKMVMINAPWYFSAIWALVSYVVDPVTANKISIIGSNYEEVLKELIDEDNIPVDCGGEAHVEWKYPYAEGTGCSPSELRDFLASKSNEKSVTTATVEDGEETA